MYIKNGILDFLCAFAIFAIILITIVLVTSGGFLDGVIVWDSETFTLTVFKSRFVFDTRVPVILNQLLDFNDTLFGNGFSKTVRSLSLGLFSVAEDFVKISYGFIKNIAGAV